MVVEILFEEVCNLYGDGQNVHYLQATLPDAQFVHTALTDEPYFAEHTPDLRWLIVNWLIVTKLSLIQSRYTL